MSWVGKINYLGVEIRNGWYLRNYCDEDAFSIEVGTVNMFGELDYIDDEQVEATPFLFTDGNVKSSSVETTEDLMSLLDSDTEYYIERLNDLGIRTDKDVKVVWVSTINKSMQKQEYIDSLNESGFDAVEHSLLVMDVDDVATMCEDNSLAVLVETIIGQYSDSNVVFVYTEAITDSAKAELLKIGKGVHVTYTLID